jgi:tetratricopeptide (TPR) repeat protein
MRLLLLLCAVAVSRADPTPAERLIEAGHWKRARTIVEARLRKAPDDALATFLLSQVRSAFGDRSSPLALAEKAVALDGRTAKYRRQIAEAVGVAAQHAGAIQQLFLARRFRKEIDAALSCDPQDIQALGDLLEFYLLAPGIAGGEPRKAVEIASQIAAIDATEGLLARARIAAFHKQVAGRETLLRQAAESQPPKYKARMALAQFYLEDGHTNLSAAAAQARLAIDLDPGRVTAYAVLAAHYADRGEWSELESALAAALREVPDDPVPYYRAAERLLAADPVRAERYLRIYLAQEPEGNQPSAADAHWKLGLALEAQGRTSDALIEFKQSVRLDPESKAAPDLKRLHTTRPAAASSIARPK